jgi:predicted transposase/invertase (TIGR01784 family)
MPYVTSIEQMGIEKGIEQGIERGKEAERRSLALKMLQESIPLNTIARITELTIDQLQQLQTENLPQSEP